MRIFSLLAGILLFSCQKENSVPLNEELSVNPTEITVPSSLSSFSVNVFSNTKWTVKVERENGIDVTWLTLGRTSGNKDIPVAIRVNENSSSIIRKASIVFETPGGKTAVLALIQEANENEEVVEDDVLRVGTYNLRMSHLDNGTDNTWDVRKARLKKSMQDCSFDVFGIQEVDDKTQAWLDAELSSKYAFRYFSPYSKDGNGSRAQGIGYRKDKFTLADWHYFWACDTPDMMTTNDTGSQGNFNRGGCCCIITEIETGRNFFVMNNHGCLNSQSNKDAAPVYVEMEKRYNKSGLPSFFVGDMNARQSTDKESVYMTYKEYWLDSYLFASKRTGCAGTYNGYSNPNGSSRIDYVFYRGEGLTPQLYHCDNTLYNGFYPSDHFPVWVEFKIEK